MRRPNDCGSTFGEKAAATREIKRVTPTNSSVSVRGMREQPGQVFFGLVQVLWVIGRLVHRQFSLGHETACLGAFHFPNSQKGTNINWIQLAYLHCYTL